MSIRTHLTVAGLSLAVILGGVAAASASEMANEMVKPAAEKMESNTKEAKNAGEVHNTGQKKNLSKKAETATKETK